MRLNLALHAHINVKLPRPIRIDRRVEDIPEDECWSGLRFRKEDLKRLAKALRIPDRFVLENRSVFNGEEAFLLTLARFAYPRRFCDLRVEWGREESQLCRAFRCVVDFLYDNFSHLLRDNLVYWSHYMPAYTRAVAAKAGFDLPYPVWGFVDGTQLEISRPRGRDDIQREVYSGHKRFHALKFQIVAAPCGLIADLFGPVSGRRHDLFALTLSTLNERCANVQRGREQQAVLYGDAGYPTCSHVKGAIRMPVGHQEQRNRQMASLRIAVEHVIGGVVNLCAFLKHDKKLFDQPIGRYYVVAALFYNCHACLYGNQTSESFNILPPRLESYLTQTAV